MCNFVGALTEENLLFLEAWRTIDRAYVDKTFNGQSWFRYRENALRNEPMISRAETCMDFSLFCFLLISTCSYITYKWIGRTSIPSLDDHGMCKFSLLPTFATFANLVTLEMEN